MNNPTKINSNKPIIVFVDDEVHNLTVFEASVPSTWEVHIFDNPLSALDQISKIDPWVVLSDQRMPGMIGINFLALVQKLCPFSIRALVTGFSDEDLVVDSVRKAHVYDYIRKPWDTEDLEVRIQKMIDVYQLEKELREKTIILEKQNNELLKLNKNLEEARNREEHFRKELESWAPPFILSALYDQNIEFPLEKDLAVITFDLVGSSKLHGIKVMGIPARNHILHTFSELVLKHSGWRESHSGDSAYAHFGMLKDIEHPAEAAYAVATEFRVFLRNFSTIHKINIESGIGLHIAKKCIINVHTTKVVSKESELTHKSFDSISPDIDLVHRMEKFSHQLPGSNIIMSDVFVSLLISIPHKLIDLGDFQFKGQTQPVHLFLKASDKVTEENISKLLEERDRDKDEQAA